MAEASEKGRFASLAEGLTAALALATGIFGLYGALEKFSPDVNATSFLLLLFAAAVALEKALKTKLRPMKIVGGIVFALLAMGCAWFGYYRGGWHYLVEKVECKLATDADCMNAHHARVARQFGSVDYSLGDATPIRDWCITQTTNPAAEAVLIKIAHASSPDRRVTVTYPVRSDLPRWRVALHEVKIVEGKDAKPGYALDDRVSRLPIQFGACSAFAVIWICGVPNDESNDSRSRVKRLFGTALRVDGVDIVTERTTTNGGCK